MTTLVPHPAPDTRPVPRPSTALVPVPRPAPPAVPGPATVAPVRRPTSGTPIVGYVTPPPYACTRRRAAARRLTIETVRTGLWLLALVPFLVVNLALLIRGAARLTATAARRRVTGVAG